RNAQERSVALKKSRRSTIPSPATPGWHFSGFKASRVNARLLIPVYLAGLIVDLSAKGEASLEGVVQLPPPAVERALNQRYVTNVEAPLTPSNPPAAVVYLEGNFATNAKSNDDAQMAQKTMLFAPDLIAVQTA